MRNTSIQCRLAVLVAAIGLAAVALPASAAEDSDRTIRIFVHSQSDELREVLGVRHDFGTYFSTIVPVPVFLELQGQGVTVEPVPTREIQGKPDGDGFVAMPACHNPRHNCDDGGGGTTPRVSDQTPYGIEQIYNSATITSTSGGAGSLLGHFDTGIDQTHVDLVNRIVRCESTATSDCTDKNGHGTHTAGTAAADAGSDDLGIWGVAPEASIYTIKVCSNGGLCFADDTNAAIDRCIAAGCHVITYSIGGDSGSETERAKIAEYVAAGGLFVAANGNDGDGTCSIDYPGGFKEANGVAAIDSSKTVASWSSRGCSADSNSFDEDGETDFAAAGVGVLSTVPGGYDTYSGTSMATPHVSGLALKKGNTRSALLNGIEDLGPSGVDIAYGNGLPHV